MEDISEEFFKSNFTANKHTVDDFTARLNLLHVIVYCVLSFCGLVANASVIYIVLRYTKMRSVSNIYNFNLALDDVISMFNLILIAPYLVLDDWPFGNIWCKFFQGMEFTNSMVSASFIMVMSIDRSVFLYRPLIAGKYRKPRVASLISAAVWAVSLVFAVTRLLFAYGLEIRDGLRICIYNTDHFSFLVTIGHFVIVLDLPVIVTFICLLMIAVKAQPAVQPLQTTEHKGSDGSRMVAMLFLVYLLCWSFPVHLLFVFSLLPYYDFLHSANIFLFILPPVKSCINPIIYWCLSDDFKQSFQRASCCRNKNCATEALETKQGESPCQKHSKSSS